MEKFLKNDRFLIKTPYGYCDFEGISIKTHNNYLKLTLENNDRFSMM